MAWVAGVFSHLAFFRIGEHHLYGMRYALTAVGSLTFSIFLHSQLSDRLILESVIWSSSLSGFYVAGIYASLVVYRCIFHPLRNIPGPLGCRISSSWFTTHLVKQDAFRQLEKLHSRYGPFLRIGSNDISVAHPKAVQAIYGPGSKCRKAAWYDLVYPMVSLQTTRDKSLHDQRRRLWSGAFGDRNMRDYEKRMVRYRALLVKAIDETKNQPFDVTKWFNLYTFDVMGDLAFGASFGMLETSKEHEAIRLLNSGLMPLAYMFPAWFFRYCTSQMEERIKIKSSNPDIMSCLLKPLNNQTPTGIDYMLLQGDSKLIVVAGSDTTSTTLIYIFRFLVEHPQHVDVLRTEFKNLARTELGDYQPPDLAELKHLNGVINEALRLCPPVPSALPRVTPREGLTIDGTFIPGNTTLYCPQYVLGRSPECYSKPEEFIPERWYSRPDLIQDASAFAPFSAGPYGCIARPLALLNIRATVARILVDYDVWLAPGVSLNEFDQGLKEHFTLAPAPLKLCFNKL
ncbi:hypothetical protein PENPOL_c010G08693 [Penicillium polonicum]|uniref:Cytochrome P450 monooxygenase poxM n=1 Tax=Penicillium polonicum TaxID=60169 RepID=A0A1V6NFD6_PENPO|nr:hypothetical protein PENPOL_c010G08693 [Penicillium polonicum]